MLSGLVNLVNIFFNRTQFVGLLDVTIKVVQEETGVTVQIPGRGCCVEPHTQKSAHRMAQTEPGQAKLQISVTRLGHGCASRLPARHLFVTNFKSLFYYFTSLLYKVSF